MTQDQIHKLFKQGYNQSNWRQFLGEAFANARLLTNPETLTGIDNNVATQAQKLGYITLNENGIERQIALYEVTLAEGIILERNRVGLRNLLRKYWKDIDAAFITYHNPKTTNWRFTYVSELTGYDADGEFIKIKTEPKRYTYVLGEGESTRTAAERFALITKKGSKATLDDVKEAFSVEKLSDTFFYEYKYTHYSNFVEALLGERVEKKGKKDVWVKTGNPSAFYTLYFTPQRTEEQAKADVRNFVKKLLGRIVFLYFIQKKGWMGVPVGSKWGQGDFNFLTNLFNQHQNPDLFYNEMLTKLFFDTLNTKREDDIIELVNGQPYRIPYLNGGLFEEDDKKQRNIILNAQLFSKLFEFFNQYNFTIYEDDPNDHTVAVDPEMLGHIFENLLEDNKDKGAFYTPKEIVHYMCQESLIEYLTTWFENKGYEVTGYISFDKPEQPRLFSANEGKKGQLLLETAPQSKGKQIDRLLIEKLLKKKLDDADKKLIQQHAAEFHKALDSVKICDPAIGSGAFPMGLLQEIFTAKQTLWHFEHGNLKDFPASKVKLNIIQHSIYGVDIEKGAVDIARLRFWLSLVVDEEVPKALPNLDYKIVIGNSLVSKLGDDIIDIDWSLDTTKGGLFEADLAKRKSELLKKISQDQKEFFDPLSNKTNLATNIRNLKIDLLINQLELMVKTTQHETEPNANNYKTKKKFIKATQLHLQTIGWKSSIKELKKLKEQPDKPLNFFDWKLDFPEVMNEQVTTNVGFDIMIGNPPYGFRTVLSKEEKGYFRKVRNINFSSGDSAELFVKIAFDQLTKLKGIQTFIIPKKSLYGDAWEDTRLSYWKKYNLIFILDTGKSFKNVLLEASVFCLKKEKPNANVKVAFLSKDGINEIGEFPLNELFAESNTLQVYKAQFPKSIIEKVERIKSKEVLVEGKLGLAIGTDFFSEEETDYKLLKGIDIQKYTVRSHRFLTNIQKVKWENAKVFLSPKVLCQVIVSHIENPIPHLKITACYDADGIIITNTLMAFEISDKLNDKFWLAYLNSKFISWYAYNFIYARAIRTMHFYNFYIQQVPIPNISKRKQQIFVDLADKILSQKSQVIDTTTLEQKIDNLIYRLYDLTYDEVKIIDPEFSLSQKEYENIQLE